MAKLRSFLDFEDRARPEWTVDIDLSKVEKTKAAFKELERYAKEAFSSKMIDNASFDGAVKALQALKKNIDAVESRYQQLKQTTESLRSSAAATTGSEAQDFLKKAQAAEQYAKSLARLKQTYSNKQWDFADSSNKNASRAYGQMMKESMAAQRAKEEPPVAETQAPIEQMNELAEASNKAREAVIDVGKAEESATPAPIENQKEAMDKLAESATRCAETVKEAATANASASMSGGNVKPPEAPKKSDAEMFTRESHTFIMTQDMDEAISKITNASHVYSELRKTVSNLSSDVKQLGMENIYSAIDPARFQATLQAFTGGLQGILKEVLVPKQALIDLQQQAQESAATVAEAWKKSEEASHEYGKAQREYAAKVTAGTATPMDKKALSAAHDKENVAWSNWYKENERNKGVQAQLNAAMVDTSNYTPALEGNERLVSTYNQLASALFTYQQAEMQLAGAKPGSKYFDHFQSNLENLRVYLISVINQFKELSGQTDKFSQNTQFSSAFSDFNQKKIEANSKILSPQKSEQMNNILNGMTPVNGGEDVQSEIMNYNQLCETIERLTKELEIYRSLVKENNGVDVTGAVENISEMEKELKSLQKLKTEIDGKNANKQPTQMAEVEEIPQAVANVRQFCEVWQDVNSRIYSAMSAVKSFASAVASMGAKLGKGLFNGIVSGVHLVQSVLSTAKNAFSQFGTTAKNALSTLGGIASKGFNAIRTGVSGAIGGLKNMASHMTRFTKSHTPNMLKSLQSIKSMLVRRLKRTFISSIFNQAKEALQQLAMQSEGFNTSMSNIKNSFSEVAGNFAVTLGNLIQIVAPIVTTVLGWINSIIQAINALFSLISGKGTMTVAKKKTDNYAKSLKSAGGSAKELNNQLYGFDEITRQDDNSGGGGGGSSPTKFEEKAIDSIIGGDLKKKLEEIINAFKSGEFRKAGQLIGNLIAEMAEKAEKKIKELRPVAAKWARNIAQVLNGIVDSDAIRNSYKAAGQAANLVLETIYSFLDEFEFDNLGRKIADAVQHSTIEWDLVGKTLAKLVNSTWSFLKGLFTNLPWRDIGSRIALGLNTAFEEIKWSDIKDALREGINGLFLTLNTILSEVNWKETAKEIFDNLVRLISEIDWVYIGQTFGLGFNTAIDILDEFFSSGALSSLGTNIGVAIENALGTIDFVHLGEVAREGCTEIAKGFGNLLTEIDFEDKATKIKAGIETFFDTEHGGAAFDSAIEALTGENKGINRIIAGFAKLVDPSEGIQFEEIGKTIGTKAGELLKGIKWSTLVKSILVGKTRLKTAFWTMVSQIPFADIAKEIANGINSFFAPDSEGKTPFEKLAANATEGFNGVVDAFHEFTTRLNLSQIRDSVVDAINTFINGAKLDQIIADIGKFVKNAGTEFAKMFSPSDGGIDLKSLATKLSDGLSNIFKDENGELDKASALELGRAIGDAIKDVLENIGNFLGDTDWSEIGQYIGNALGKIDWAGIAGKAIKLLWNGLLAAVKLTGGLIGAFITRLFGIENIDTFDGASKEWASGFADSVENATVEEFANSSRQQQVAKLAALYASGLGQEFLDAFQTNEQWNQATAQEAFSSFNTSLQNAFASGDKSSAINAIVDYMKVTEEEAEALLASGAFGTWDDEWGNLFDASKLYELLNEGASKEQILQWFSSLGLTINEGLENAVDILTAGNANLSQSAMHLIATLQDLGTKATFEQLKAAFGEAGIDVCDEFIKNVGGTGTANIAAALQLLGMGVSDEAIAALDTSNLSENLDQYMKESGASIEAVVAALMLDSGASMEQISETLGADVGTKLGDIIPSKVAEALGKGKTKVEETAAEVAGAAAPTQQQQTDAAEQGKKTGEGVTNAVETATEAGQKGVEDKTGEVTSAVAKKYEALPKEVKPYANDLMSYILTAITEGDEPIQQAIKSITNGILDEVKTKLAGSAGVRITTDFMAGLSQGIGNMSGTLVSRIRTATLTTQQLAQAYLSEQNGKTIGSNMMIGLINGLIAYSDLLVLIMATICNATVDTAREILGIASPSKVFAEIGKYTVEGMEQGIADNGHKAVDAISDVAQSIENEGAVEMTVQSMVDGLDIVEGKMARLADIFSGIAETITSMGNFELPAMAKGQVIPYRSRVEGGTAGFGGAESSVSQSDIEDAMYSALVRAMDNRADSQPIVINLDGRRLAEVVSRYQRQNVRSMGV